MWGAGKTVAEVSLKREGAAACRFPPSLFVGKGRKSSNVHCCKAR